MTHDQLQEDLACHLRAGTDRMVWTNTQLGPVGSPRPDLFTVNKSFSKFASDAYEIKVSVSDLRSDVTSGKWQSYRKFAHRVWFAYPRGMVPLDLIPKECGVICRSELGWRAVRKPVAQVLDTLPRDAWLKLLMDLHPVNSAGFVRAPRHANEYTSAEIVRKKLGKEMGELFADVKRAESSLSHRKATLDAERNAITAGLEVTRKQAYESAKRAAERLEASLLELADALGVPEDDRTPGAMCAAIYQFRKRLSGDGIDRAIDLLNGLRGALPKAMSAGEQSLVLQ